MAKMLSKKKRTLDVYKRTGAKVRLCREVLAITVCALGGVLKADEWAKVRRAVSLLEEACDRAENRMFHDYPGVGNKYLHVFHGSMSDSPVSALDVELHKLEKDFSDAVL